METSQLANDRFEEFLLAPHSRGRRGDALIRIHISRNTLLAIAFSLLVHALFLFFTLPLIQFDNTSSPLPTAIEVSLAPPILPKVIEPALPEIPLEKLVPKVVKSIPKVMTQKQSKNTKPSFNVPEVIAKPTPSPEVAPSNDRPKNAPDDMGAQLNAKRAQRLASEGMAAKENAEAVARENGPSAEQIRDERIKNNFKNGTNGIFEITSLSVGGQHATFSFKGWTNDYSSARRESFEVEAGAGQDVRLVMIKKMIWLIRQHYQGDFNWESQRLRRTVIQSARPEDSAGLEDFMMMEFFGTNYKNAS